MTGKLKFFMIIAVVFCCFYKTVSSGAEYTVEDISIPDKANMDFQPPFTPVRLTADPMYIYNKDSDFQGIAAYTAEIDFLRYQYYVLSFSMNQALYYKDSESENFNFNKIQYTLEYLNLRKEFKSGSLSGFLDHRCTNFINTTSSDDIITRWYGIGLRWETRGMTIGNKNKQNGVKLFSSDNYINYSIALRKSIATISYPATWTSDFKIRYDYYMTDFFAGYLYGSAEYFVSDQYSWNRSIEGGVRLSMDMIEISPYIRYEYVTDDIGETPKGKYHRVAGLRAETALSDAENKKTPEKNRKNRQFESPELHFTGSYEYYAGDIKKNFRATTLFALDLIKYGTDSAFFNASLKHSSSKENSGMYPAYIDTSYEGGISLLIFKKIFIDPFYSYTAYDEGNIIRTGPWNYHLAALRIRTTGMKPGFIEKNTRGKADTGFSFINNLELEMTGGNVIKTEGIDADWMINSNVRWDIFSYNSNIVFLTLGEKCLTGEKISLSFISEFGIRLSKDPVIMLFFSNEFNNSNAAINDVSRVYHLIGIRLDF